MSRTRAADILQFYGPAPLLAMIPVVSAAKLYAASTPLSAAHVIRDLLAAATPVTLLATILMALPGPHRTKGAALSIGVLLSGAYPALAGALEVGPCTWWDTALGALVAAALAVSMYAIGRRAPQVLDQSVGMLWLLTVAFACYASYRPVVSAIHAPRAMDRAALGGPQVALAAGSPVPDIIHIVFDGLGRLDVLERDYGIGAATVRARLEERGMSVSDDAVANYAQTYLAVAAALSMEYVNEASRLAATDNDRTLTAQIIDQSSVIRALKARGYRFTLLSNGYEALVDHPLADDGIRGSTWFGQFEGYLLPRTPWRALPVRALTFAPHRARTRSILDALRGYAPGERPRYVLAHVLLPHPPFVLDADGRDRVPGGLFTLEDASAFPGTREEYRAGYAEQAAYTLRVLEQLLDAWSRFARPPIVIAHGDHGPGLGYDIRTPISSNTEGRMAIFLGVRRGGWPIGNVRSPVNVYRTLFSGIFGATLPSLPDRSFVSSWQKPFEFHEVGVNRR
jgi:hypothetical protein